MSSSVFSSTFILWMSLCVSSSTCIVLICSSVLSFMINVWMLMLVSVFCMLLFSPSCVASDLFALELCPYSLFSNVSSFISFEDSVFPWSKSLCISLSMQSLLVSFSSSNWILSGHFLSLSLSGRVTFSTVSILTDISVFIPSAAVRSADLLSAVVPSSSLLPQLFILLNVKGVFSSHSLLLISYCLLSPSFTNLVGSFVLPLRFII